MDKLEILFAVGFISSLLGRNWKEKLIGVIAMISVLVIHLIS